MLQLKRVQRFNEFITCQASGELISWGDFYYQDSDDGAIIKASVYRDLRDTKQLNEFDNTRFDLAVSEEEYKRAVRRYTQEYLSADIFNRQVEGKEVY